MTPKTDESLKELVEELQQRVTVLEQKVRALIVSELKRVTSVGEPATTGINSNGPSKATVEGLSVKLSVTTNELSELFDIEGQSMTLTKLPSCEIKEKTQQSVLALLVGYKYVIGLGEVPSIQLRKNIAEHGVSIANFATYVKELEPSLLKRKGKAKSPKTAYRLTILGEAKGREIIKSLLEELKSESGK